jgi:hypothetical protein
LFNFFTRHQAGDAKVGLGTHRKSPCYSAFAEMVAVMVMFLSFLNWCALLMCIPAKPVYCQIGRAYNWDN